MRVSVAVPAYNEEKNIGHLLDVLRGQRTRRAQIVEIVVVASGCVDKTVEIVRERMRGRGVPVRLIVEAERRGKVAAINTYLRHGDPRVEAICLCSADVLPALDAVERLVQRLCIDPAVGMAGAHPTPTNGHGTFLGEATRFLWRMHHKVALEAPKVGEMAMLRAGIVRGPLPEESPVDEASLEQLMVAGGYKLAYVPEAVVHNHGPETLRDFVRQRRRIAAGHYWLRDARGYAVSTMDLGRVVRLTLPELDPRRPFPTLCAVGTIGLEAVSRALGWVDSRTGGDVRKHAVWAVSDSTKVVLSDEEVRVLRDQAPDEAGATVVPIGRARAALR